jgi:peptide-methionine (S)-S-oxide reductase
VANNEAIPNSAILGSWPIKALAPTSKANHIHGMEQTAIFAGGCFWCVEAVFQNLNGVHGVESGYLGGHVDNPTYKQVCGGDTGHAEAILIRFDADIISYSDLLDVFFATHDPTQLNRQGNDIGTQYRSAIFPQDDAQLAEAEAGIIRAQPDWPAPIVTSIEANARWWPAEDYHQNYWNGEGQRNPYCLAVIPPKLAKLKKLRGGVN